MTGTITDQAPSSFDLSHTGTNTTLALTATGAASVDSGALKYTVNGVTLDKVTVTGAGTEADALPDGWTAAESLPVDTEAFPSMTAEASSTPWRPETKLPTSAA